MALVLIALLLALLLGPQLWVRRVLATYREPAERYAGCGTGADFARHLLARHDLGTVTVETTALGDHYDPCARSVRLLPLHHDGRSLAAVTIAATLASDDILAATAKKLPDNRFFEMYLGVGEVFNMVGAMMGFEAPEGLPPIALGMGSAKNAMTFGLSIDKRVFTTIMEMQGGMGEGMGDEMGDEDDGSF